MLEAVPGLERTGSETVSGSGFCFCFLPIILDSARVTRGRGC